MSHVLAHFELCSARRLKADGACGLVKITTTKTKTCC